MAAPHKQQFADLEVQIELAGLLIEACAEHKAKDEQISTIVILETKITEAQHVDGTVEMITDLVVHRHHGEAMMLAMVVEVETTTILHQEIAVDRVHLTDEERVTDTGIDLQVREHVRLLKMLSCRFHDAAQETCQMFR